MKVRLFHLALAVALAACDRKEPSAPAPTLEPPPTKIAPPPGPRAREARPEWLSQLSPQAQEAWLRSKHKPDLSRGPIHLLAKLPSKQQVDLVKSRDDAPEADAYRRRREAEDRTELVRPAPPEFKPEGRRMARLRLIPKSPTMRVGENFWYRLEFQNIGEEPITLDESPSFWKIGNALNNKVEFRLIPPEGKEERGVVNFQLGHCVPNEHEFPKYVVTEKDRERFLADLTEKRRREISRWKHLMVTLQPGETLFTRPWAWGDDDERTSRRIECEIPDSPVTGEFRELVLRSGFKFDRPGAYRIKAIYMDPHPKPPTEEEFQRGEKFGVSRRHKIKRYEERLSETLGIVESIEVTVDVHQ